MKYGYVRVNDKNLDEAIKKLQEYGCRKIFYDKIEGYNDKKVNLIRLIDRIQKDDIVVIESLIQISGKVNECENIIERIIFKEGSIHVLDLGIINNSCENSILKTIKAIVKLDKDQKTEVANIGKEIVRKNKGYREGRPKKYSEKQIKNALSLLTIYGGKMSYTEVSQLTKISRSTLIRESKRER
ncbi:MAG: recombinase family protein [Clostridium sp.]|uniref:recombinase family protein n=1 Tax=Clostridium sp. TaxID=1506 RepID=UPI003EE6A397